MIKAFIPWSEKTETIVITGGSNRLGNWNPAEGLPMKRIEPFFFASDLNIEKNEEWKLVSLQNGKETWEEGENRVGHPTENVCFRGRPKAVGIEVPLFSLRSPSDNGIGDFGSLQQFITQIIAGEYTVVQLLPVNDTGVSPDPFEIISSFAINPIYLCLDKMGALRDVDVAHIVADKSEEFSYSHVVEWKDVREIKWTYFRAIFAQDGEDTLKSTDFQNFVEREKEWLLPYSVFCYLKNSGKIEPYSPSLVNRLSSEKEVLFHAFLQYHADRQLQQIHSECSKAGISLAGEIPYGVSPESVDVWQYPGLFKTDFNVGTMPDAECCTGHKWNRIPYNWKSKGMDKWWKSRLKKMSRYFDICRLDNTMGYFRQWMVPRNHVTSIRGQIEPCKSYSLKELRDAGYNTGVTKDLEPLITKEYLQKVISPEFKRFGEFFKRRLDGRYYFKKEMDSAYKICEYFENRKGDDKAICLGLVKIMDECLFIKTPGGFQPRIAAQYTNAYNALDVKQKEIFNRIYDSFYYSDENKLLWIENGKKHLKMISRSTSMLLYADCMAPAIIQDLLFLAVERKGEVAGNMDIFMPSMYDMAPFKQWWSSLTESAKQTYWSNVMKWKDKASSKPIPAIYSDIVKRLRRSKSPLVILPIQDICKQAKDYNGVTLPEQIAIPEERENGWQWRMPT